MKIEKINENQIRCTLSKQDLTERKLRLSELTYGSEKAKKLFSDMMQEAFVEYGFEAQNIPLMIEAIPTSSESLVLIITKVENPDELDARFSTFTPNENEEEEEDSENPIPEFANSLLDQLSQIGDSLLKKLAPSQTAGSKEVSAPSKDAAEDAQLTKEIALAAHRLFVFHQIDCITNYARMIARTFHGTSTLYRNQTEQEYILCLNLQHATAESFNRICNIACEYGTALKGLSLSFCEEHYQVLIRDNAIETLAAFA